MNDKTGHSFASYFKRAVSPLMVLGLLRERTMYGYELSQEIERRGAGRLNIAVLYPVLYRLEEQGFVRVSDVAVENSRARTYYSATAEGLAYLEKTSAEFRDLAGLLESFIGGGEKNE